MSFSLSHSSFFESVRILSMFAKTDITCPYCFHRKRRIYSRSCKTINAVNMFFRHSVICHIHFVRLIYCVVQKISYIGEINFFDGLLKN